jgi:plasmid stabilization system protein ParE
MRQIRLAAAAQADLIEFVVSPYLIFYQILPDEIEIIRVLHGARNLPEFF